MSEQARAEAKSQLSDPHTSADTLASLAERHPELAGEIAEHPNCYPELRTWALAAASAPPAASTRAGRGSAARIVIIVMALVLVGATIAVTVAAIIGAE